MARVGSYRIFLNNFFIFFKINTEKKKNIQPSIRDHNKRRKPYKPFWPFSMRFSINLLWRLWSTHENNKKKNPLLCTLSIQKNGKNLREKRVSKVSTMPSNKSTKIKIISNDKNQIVNNHTVYSSCFFFVILNISHLWLSTEKGKYIF
jgi:hypothetical protein